MSPPNPSSPAPDRPAPAKQEPDSLRHYEVILCVSGGIAAYKTAVLVSRLVQADCGVTVAMTRNARRLVGPATFRALTRRPVLTSLWRADVPSPFGHLDPGEAADLIVVAPASANIIGKLAGGIADDLVSTLLMGADCPVMLAPAMNMRMWRHPAVQRNLAFLGEHGFALVGPEEGHLACGDEGPGRMSEPAVLFAAIRQTLLRKPAKRITPGSE